MHGYYIIKCTDIDRNHLESGKSLYIPGYNCIYKLKDGTYHLPIPSTPQTLEETLQFCHTYKSSSYFRISYHSEQEEQELKTNPIWSKARPDHLGLPVNYLEENQEELHCYCCDNTLGFRQRSSLEIEIICISCKKNCINKKYCQQCLS